MRRSIRESVYPELAPVEEGSPAARARRSPFADVARRWPGRVGLGIAVVVVTMALVGPALAPHDPFVISGGALVAPTVAHPMGTDALGRDVFSAVLFGARTSLFVATAASIIAVVCGTVVGMLAGYHRGMLDDAFMRTTELFQVIPRFFFAVIAIALFGPGLTRMVLVLGVTSWPVIARVVRGEVIAMRDLDFIRAAEALGGSASHIIWRQLLPNVLPTLIVAVGLLFGQLLLLEATLGFLGLGDPSAISWGMMAAQAQGYLRVGWWLALFPGLAIMVTVLGANLLADAFSSSRALD